MQAHCSKLLKPLASTATAMMMALALAGLIFPASLFAQPSLGAIGSDTSARTLKVDESNFDSSEGPAMFRVNIPGSEREFLFLKADDGYFFSDANDPSVFGFFNNKDVEGESEITFQPGAGSAHGSVPTRDSDGNLVKVDFDVVESASGQLSVTFDTGDFGGGLKDGVPHLVIDSPTLGLNSDQTKGIVITIVIIIVIIGGCIALTQACRSACINECIALNMDFLNVSTVLCGLLSCTCKCERRQPELPPECV